MTETKVTKPEVMASGLIIKIRFPEGRKRFHMKARRPALNCSSAFSDFFPPIVCMRCFCILEQSFGVSAVACVRGSVTDGEVLSGGVRTWDHCVRSTSHSTTAQQDWMILCVLGELN